MLLEDIFRSPSTDIVSVAIVQNLRGVQGDNFSFTNEFAVFVVPQRGLPDPANACSDIRVASASRTRPSAMSAAPTKGIPESTKSATAW